VEETPIETADGSYEVSLSVKFAKPSSPAKNAPAIPLMSLAPQVSQGAGSLKGGRSYYYAISAIGSDGSESPLSFVARATVAAGTDNNSVTLHDLSFAPGTTSFNVYRGLNPSQLLRIAKDEAVTTQWIDAGADEELAAPPDANYHHANFYWRMELLPLTAAETQSGTTIGNAQLRMLPNEFRGKLVRICTGKGRGQERTVLSNTETVLTVGTQWTIDPDATSSFVVIEPTWNFAALTEVSPVVFRVPNRENAVVHISGRAANVHDRECSYELSPLTRWTIGGAAGDKDVPEAPIFGLNSPGQGTCEVSGIGFHNLENTRTISAGSLTLHYWNELSGTTTFVVAEPMTVDSDVLRLSAAGPFQVGSVVQIGAELVSVDEVSEDGLILTVQRGRLGSNPGEHNAGEKVWPLDRKAFVLPFLRGIFGTPASGSYSQVLVIPDIRIIAAEMYVTNVKGNSQVGVACYSGLIDGGIRTLSGGQISLQVNGPLAVQSNAVPQLSIESSHAVRDVFANVIEPPTGGPMEVRVTSDGETYCSLTIPEGETLSDPVIDGLSLPPLVAGWKLGLDVIGVGGERPGAGLTVTLRL
jgi:hypothetical protein